MVQGKRKWKWVAAAVALLGAVLVAGTTYMRTVGDGSGSIPKRSPVTAAGVETPDMNRMMRDYRGVGPDGQIIDLVPGMQFDFWGAYTFKHLGQTYHSAFYMVSWPDRDNLDRVCSFCGPQIGAATYRKRGSEWDFISTDFFVATIGGFGKGPSVDHSAGLALGGTPAISILSAVIDEGVRVDSAHVLAYRDGWKLLGAFPTGEDNTAARKCARERHCYSWKGQLKVLDVQSNQLPHIEIDRQGLEESKIGVLQPASPKTYQFVGKAYQETGPMSASAGAAPLRAQAPKRGSDVQGSAGRQWYTADASATACIRSNSPASRIEMIQTFGKHAKTNDLPKGVVEVIEPTTEFKELVWTYYPDEATCMAALPVSQAIPSRYR